MRSNSLREPPIGCSSRHSDGHVAEHAGKVRGAIMSLMTSSTTVIAPYDKRTPAFLNTSSGIRKAIRDVHSLTDQRCRYLPWGGVPSGARRSVLRLLSMASLGFVESSGSFLKLPGVEFEIVSRSFSRAALGSAPGGVALPWGGRRLEASEFGIYGPQIFVPYDSGSAGRKARGVRPESQVSIH